MFNFPWQGNYDHIPQTEDSAALISDDSSLESKPYTRQTRSSLPPLLLVILLAIYSILTPLLGLYIGRRFPSSLDATCTEHVSKYCKWPLLIYADS